MSWWKRLILTIISLIWGFVSLDYLYLAFGFLTGSRAGSDMRSPQERILWELLGLLLFLAWVLLLAVYTWLIRRLSPDVDLIEVDQKSGRERVRRKWFDVILQYGFVVTGILIRWGYLCIFYFPSR